MSQLIKETLLNLVDIGEEIKDISYKIYWLANKHCEDAVPVLQVDKRIAWVCKHYK